MGTMMNERTPAIEALVNLAKRIEEGQKALVALKAEHSDKIAKAFGDLENKVPAAAIMTFLAMASNVDFADPIQVVHFHLMTTPESLAALVDMAEKQKDGKGENPFADLSMSTAGNAGAPNGAPQMSAGGYL